ncbi:MAG: flagellin [Betaproteobacteria bacterium]|nr:flagellin [Betaproteobacteria bacterium]
MPQIINTNVASLNAQRNLNVSQSALATSLQRLSSGLRINSAKDDAAGLAISERFTAQIRGLDQARRNANDGVSLAQTAEGALQTAGDILQRIRELAVQSANASNSAGDRQALNAEVTQLASELDRVAQTSEFNGLKLLDGSFGSATFQVGANANQTITATTGNFRTNQYGNYRIGSLAATASNPDGDLTAGSTANAIASNAAATSRVAGGTITINGAVGSATITAAAAASAKTVAGQINAQTANTGVTASAITQFDLTAFTASSSYSLNVTSNNTTAVTVAFTVGATVNTDGLSSAVSAINDVSSKTGVTAKVNTAGTGITLLNQAGENITIANNAGSTTVTVGGTATAAAASAVGTGQIVLDSDKTFNVAAANTTDFFTAVTAAGQLQKVGDLDVGSVAAANRSLSIVDSALASINGQRAKFGALQARFENTISNLQTTSENLSSARSRIRDADFAQETAALTRGQILQQAGVAILAQANASSNSVLSLLK